MAVIIFPVGNVTVRGIIVYTIAGSFAANLRLTNDHVASVSSIASTSNEYIQINIRGHVAVVCYQVMACQPFPLTFYLLAASVFLLLLVVHAHITELRSLITR